MNTDKLKKYLEEESIEEQKGAVYAGLALAYLQTVNGINAQYLDMLKKAARILKTVNKKL